MAARQLTSFEHILLGLICMEPSSGYDLKRDFATTPLGAYQPSSGSLYPALRRLETNGMVQAHAGSSPAGQSARQRRMYESTETGRAVHTRWLRNPVEPATVAQDLGLHLMRFVMMEHQLSPDEILAFLKSLADALAAFNAGLEQYTAGDPHPDQRHGRLALEHGLAVHQASLRWVEQTIAVFSADAAAAGGLGQSSAVRSGGAG